MQTIRVFNTFSGAKEPFPETGKGPLRLFVCGPTVYDAPHIGNHRTYMVFDLFTRYLRSQGIKVFYLQNITDVDDKIIARAQVEETTPKAIAQKFERLYHADERLLGIRSVTKYARATNYIPEIVRQIETLVTKGHAYLIPGDGYYFNIFTFPDYGKLARRTATQAEDGVSRIDESVRKRNKGDFCLWKFATKEVKGLKIGNWKLEIVDGEPAWNASLGWGRPGWHIEDTAIAEHFFGPQYDIHGGGIDLKFPHHEAEIAQQESASGKKPMASIWMHVGALTVNGEKMAKSKGNFITIRDFLKRHSADTFRYLVLSHHYRSPLDYTEKLAEDAERTLASIHEFLTKLTLRLASKKGAPARRAKNEASVNRETATLLKHVEECFRTALADDFNTPEALAAVFELMNGANARIFELARPEARALQRFIQDAFLLFGIEFLPPNTPRAVVVLAKKRELFRRSKQFAQADALRRTIESLGYRVEDTPAGALILPKISKS